MQVTLLWGVRVQEPLPAMQFQGFEKTGLGERLANLFVRALGKSSLGLAIGLNVAECLLAPAMPSTSARAGEGANHGTLLANCHSSGALLDSINQKLASSTSGLVVISCGNGNSSKKVAGGGKTCNPAHANVFSPARSTWTHSCNQNLLVTCQSACQTYQYISDTTAPEEHAHN